MAMTMTQKILAAHAGLESVKAGQLIMADLDLVLGNDITSPVAINEFRKKRFEFQKYEGEDLFEKIDEFQREYQTFKEEPIVREYLAAELEICRLVQEIYGAIDELVDIDMEME